MVVDSVYSVPDECQAGRKPCMGELIMYHTTAGRSIVEYTLSTPAPDAYGPLAIVVGTLAERLFDGRAAVTKSMPKQLPEILKARGYAGMKGYGLQGMQAL